MRTTFSLNFLEYPGKVYRPKGQVWLVFLSLKTKFVAGGSSSSFGFDNFVFDFKVLFLFLHLELILILITIFPDFLSPQYQSTHISLHHFAWS